MTKPTIFVGCASEALDAARAIQENLNDSAEVSIWKDNVFPLSSGTLERLVEVTHECDFAIFVLSPEDALTTRGATSPSVRDNVLFELGLFMGTLGRQRTFGFYEDSKKPKLATDLDGVTFAQYETRSDGNLKAALSVPCNIVRAAVRKLGRSEHRRFKEHARETSLLRLRQQLLTYDAIEPTFPVSDVWRREVDSKIERLAGRAQDWSKGLFRIKENYTEVLKSVFRHAAKNVFSTSVPEYLAAWQGPLGADLLAAQRNNRRAKATRVFIFRTGEDIGDEEREIFRLHRDAGVEVRLCVQGPGSAFEFPPELGPDWVVADDGVVIGVTRRFGEMYEADWFLANPEYSNRFNEYRDRLRAASEPFA